MTRAKIIADFLEKILIIVFFLPLFVSCKTPRRVTSGLKVGGGHSAGAQDDSSPVVRFSFSTNAKLNACSGVFIDERVILTAAHCLVDQSSGGLLPATAISIDSHFVAIEFTTIDTNFLNGNLSERERQTHDLGAIFVKSPADEEARWLKNRYRLEDGAKGPRIGDKIEVIGYGKVKLSDTTGADTPHFGFNTLDVVSDTFLEFGSEILPQNGSDAQADDAATLPGDSGGPVLSNNFLVGITTSVRLGLGAAGVTVSQTRSRAINLAGPIALNFLRKIEVVKSSDGNLF